MLKILIVDDEPLARENLCVLLQPVADVIVAGECENAVEALGAINRLRPDVVFLDIHMPRISGLELVGMIDPERMPHIVFLTAYDEYALQAFEENAFDYLLKPVQASRLEKTFCYSQILTYANLITGSQRCMLNRKYSRYLYS